jgi:biotin carboxyl carrier protein
MTKEKNKDQFQGKEMKTLIVQGAVYQTTLTWKFENRVKYVTPNPNYIYSFIPGTVIDIFVKTKQKVREGETLLLLEAMKMQNQVRMPFDGQIVKIHVKKDQVIPKKFLMLEIKPAKL